MQPYPWHHHPVSMLIIFFLSLIFRTVTATKDVTIGYNLARYHPSRNNWGLYGEGCIHAASRAEGVGLSYTFTGIAIKLYLPAAGNVGRVKITTDWNGVSFHNLTTSNTEIDCTTFVEFTGLNYTRHHVEMNIDGGGYLNMYKFVVTTYTDDELDMLAVQGNT